MSYSSETHRDKLFALKFTPTDNLQFPVSLMCMSLDCDRKPERTYLDTLRTFKRHKERPQVHNLQPCYRETTVLTTAPPCSPSGNIMRKTNTTTENNLLQTPKQQTPVS